MNDPLFDITFTHTKGGEKCAYFIKNCQKGYIDIKNKKLIFYIYNKEARGKMAAVKSYKEEIIWVINEGLTYLYINRNIKWPISDCLLFDQKRDL